MGPKSLTPMSSLEQPMGGACLARILDSIPGGCCKDAHANTRGTLRNPSELCRGLCLRVTWKVPSYTKGPSSTLSLRHSLPEMSWGLGYQNSRLL